MILRPALAVVVVVGVSALAPCGMALADGPAAAPSPAIPAIPPGVLDPSEVHLRNLRQITFGGENAEAYWSFQSTGSAGRLTLQSTRDQDRCDQIYLQDVPPSGTSSSSFGSALPAAFALSRGHGRHTCSFFFPDGDRLLFSSTRHDGDACPPPPDRSKGYVWPLYHYQIYTALPDGGDVRRLTQSPGYDAEATVCRDGSVIFTSDRDGDLELYRMRLDGSGLTRLTHSAGYDGGAFFSEDCQHIVWRADHPRNDAERAEMKELLGKHLVRPSRMELWVADADGNNAHQVTDLGAASFAPFFFPKSLAGAPARRIIFASNYLDPKHREFDLWAINDDGTELERITHTPEFDGFPMFTPDGKRLAFSSNRGGKQHGETNVYVADWVQRPPGKGSQTAGKAAGVAGVAANAMKMPTAADEVAARIGWLADLKRQGRGVGTAGLTAAGDQIAGWMKEEGLVPAGDPWKNGKGRSWFQPVVVFVGVRDTGSRFSYRSGRSGRSGKNAGGAGDKDVALSLGGGDVGPAAMSDSKSFGAELAFAGYGISAPEAKWDDLAGAAGAQVKDRVAVVLRGVPDPRLSHLSGAAAQSYSDLRYKAWNLREHGAAAVVFVDLDHDGVPKLALDGPEGAAGLPVMFASRDFAAGLLSAKPAPSQEERQVAWKALREGADTGHVDALKLSGTLSGTISLKRESRVERNVVGMLPRGGAAETGGAGGGAAERSGAGGKTGGAGGERTGGAAERSGAGGDAAAAASAPAIVLGAHYDHLGLGGHGSFVPDERVVHPGADDNASGVAALLHAAGLLAKTPARPADLYFVAFTGEEVGLVGSSHFVQQPVAGLTRERMRAMINFDMVGRLSSGKSEGLPVVVVQGTDSAAEWPGIVSPLCQAAGLSCRQGGDGYGPSDMTPFYAASVPVLFFFTGAHADYHRPSDTADKINHVGVAQIAALAADVVGGLLGKLAANPAPLSFKKPGGPPPRGGDSRGYGAYLGTIPDYTAMQGATGGVKLTGARPGSPAGQAGVVAGDVLIGLGGHDISTLEDMAFVLRALKPGQQVDLVLLRDGKKQTQKVTLQQRPK